MLDSHCRPMSSLQFRSKTPLTRGSVAKLDSNQITVHCIVLVPQVRREVWTWRNHSKWRLQGMWRHVVELTCCFGQVDTDCCRCVRCASGVHCCFGCFGQVCYCSSVLSCSNPYDFGGRAGTVTVSGASSQVPRLQQSDFGELSLKKVGLRWIKMGNVLDNFYWKVALWPFFHMFGQVFIYIPANYACLGVFGWRWGLCLQTWLRVLDWAQGLALGTEPCLHQVWDYKRDFGCKFSKDIKIIY